ncbi:hypothetical protein [Absidia glauca]|uniref:PWWP domain-containing protein n=1 Tax=Absidia glauca TaxID=4829 RepID=A0A163JPV1_ABSGL|nr:hypothetical protein [Absidia glauca]
MGQTDTNVYPPGTVVFAKLKGYPWWPAKIEDESSVPAKVMKQKTKTKSPIWTVFFFGSRDYGFFGPDSIRPFDKVNVEKDLKAKKFKTKDLEMAVREALDPRLMDQDAEDEGEEDDNDDDEELPEEKAPQPKKKANKAAATGKGTSTTSSSPKKSKVAKSEEDADTLSVNNKRIADDEEMLDKKKRVSRRKSMSVETEDQQPNGSDRSNASSSSPVTPRKSEDGLNKAHESPEFTREFKRLYHLRHRLQKMMYEKKPGDIPLDDYPKISLALKDVEESPMTYDLLRHTKIGKVVKHGIGYQFVDDTEFNIHERCQQLMRKWKEQFLDSKDQGKANHTPEPQNRDPTPTLHE